MIVFLLALALQGGFQDPADVDFLPPGAVAVAPDTPPLAGRVQVIHWPGDEHRVERVLRVLEVHHRLPALPDGLPTHARIYLAPDRERFDLLTGGRVPEWGAGVAVPSLDRIVIPLFSSPWGDPWGEDRTLRHEWAHLGLHEYMSGLRIPRWFDEGYAQIAAGSWSVEEAWRLRIALASGRAPPLDSLSLNWPRDQGSARIAYLLSATAVEFLRGRAGDRGLEVLLPRWREEGSFERGLRLTFGFTTASFESAWRSHVTRRYGWLYLLSQSLVFWAILSILVLFLFHRRRVRDRERLERLRAEELPDDPAYWIWAADRVKGVEEGEGGERGPTGGGRRPTGASDDSPEGGEPLDHSGDPR